MKLRKQLARVLVDSGINLHGKERIKEAAKVLIERRAVKDYHDLWRDISAQLIEPARIILAEREAKQAASTKRARDSFCRALKVESWAAALKLPEDRIAAVRLRSVRQREQLEELRRERDQRASKAKARENDRIRAEHKKESTKRNHCQR